MNCSVSGCDQQAKTKGLCRKHYARLRRTGDPNKVRPPGTPGDSRNHPLYGAWSGMKNRCHNPNNSSFYRYGGVGITVCERWRIGEGGRSGFQCFLDDMGERPAGKTLDRRNPDGPYAPDNCVWATAGEQRRNMSERGKQQATTKGSAAKRSADYSPDGEALYAAILARGTSVNAFAQSLGFGPSYLFAVLRGRKRASAKLENALILAGLPIREFTEPERTSQK